MEDFEFKIETSPDHLPRIGSDVVPELIVELPDLSLPAADEARLRQALLGGCIQLHLPESGPALHRSLLAYIESRLAGRGEVVWQEGDLINIAFGVFSHADRAEVQDFADCAASMLGASVTFASTIGLVAPAEANFLQF